MAKKFLIINLVFCHLLINSIVVFHYMADFSNHGGESFHLHIDEQLYLGMLDHDDRSVDTSNADISNNHTVNSNVADSSAAELANANVIQGHSSDEGGGSYETDANLMPLFSIESDHDDNNHFHMQLQYLANVSYDLPTYLNHSFQPLHQSYLDAIPSLIIRPPIS